MVKSIEGVKSPSFCYIYFDNGIPVYVGKVNEGNSLDRRIIQHKKDDWYKENLEIYYTPLNSSATADMVETALIGELKPKFNIAKTSWGNSKLIHLSDFGWLKYEYSKEEFIKKENELKNWEQELRKIDESKLTDSIYPIPYMLDEVIGFLKWYRTSDIWFCGANRESTYEVYWGNSVNGIKDRGTENERVACLWDGERHNELFIPKDIRFYCNKNISWRRN